MPGRCTTDALRRSLPSDLGLELGSVDQATIAALWVLSLFPHADARVWNHLGTDGIDFDRLLAGNSSGRPLREQLLLRAAASIATTRWETSLHDLAAELDPVGWAVLCEALRVARLGLAGGSR